MAADERVMAYILPNPYILSSDQKRSYQDGQDKQDDLK
jgi:hypothetical protein